MRLKLLRSTGSHAKDRLSLICGGAKSAVLLKQYKNRLLLLTAEDRATFGDGGPHDIDWTWRHPLRILRLCDCVDGYHSDPCGDDDFAQFRGCRYCCCSYSDSYTGVWLFDTTPEEQWACVYDDVSYIADNLDCLLHKSSDIVLHASAGSWLADRRLLCYKHNAGVVLSATEGLLLVALPYKILMFRETSQPRLCFDTVQWNGTLYEFTGRGFEFDGDTLDASQIYANLAELIGIARNLPDGSSGFISDCIGSVMMRLHGEPSFNVA